MPGTASVPAIAGWTCDVSVVAACADASSVGMSSTTFTTSASATSSATSCAGPDENDSSRVFEDVMSEDSTGAPIGAVLAARASRGVVDGALVVSGVGEPVPLLAGRAGAGDVGSTCSSTTLLGASVACAGVARGCGWLGVHDFEDPRAPIPTQLTVAGLFSGYVCLNSPGASGLVSMWPSVSIICLISSMLLRLFSSRPLNSARCARYSDSLTSPV